MCGWLLIREVSGGSSNSGHEGGGGGTKWGQSLF